MNGMFLIFATFLAAVIEGIKMMAILVGVGAMRGWQPTLIGTLAGFALLAASNAVAGERFTPHSDPGPSRCGWIITADPGSPMVEEGPAAARPAAFKKDWWEIDSGQKDESTGCACR